MRYQEVVSSDEVGMDLLPPQAALDSPEAECLLAGSRGSIDIEEEGYPAKAISTKALACLLLQHLSSTINSAAYDFAMFLFLIEVFPDTLVPASLVGLATKAAGLALSATVGGLVDTTARLPFVRWAIVCQKGLKIVSYCLFLVLFGPLSSVAAQAFFGQAPIIAVVATWGIILALLVCSAMLGLSHAGLEVAIERDWITTIAGDDNYQLTRLNTHMRRIDLISKLCAPLIVSLLTSSVGYPTTTIVLLSAILLTMLTEFWWIEIVYRCFPDLATERVRKPAEVESETRGHGVQSALQWLRREKADWLEFSRLPIFFSSISIAAIYLTTLSFDGTFIAYIKAARGWDDSFIAAMRALCVVTGLAGTAVMPVLERAVGLERAGAWSIWFEVGCLTPVLVAFFCGTGGYGEHGEVWNSVLLFGGIALSRIGLWSFDLCQLKELQLALQSHPNRNRLTALQISLQNLFDLLKYALALAAFTPRSFKWTAVVSWLAVVCGGVSYLVYLREVRGHLLHLDWVKKVW